MSAGARRRPASREARLAWAAAALLPGALLLFQLLRSTVFAIHTPPSFDGGLNLNVAANVADGGRYGFFYDSFFAFPAETDGPYILPAALVFWLGGITAVSAQLVNLAYLLGFAVVLQMLFQRLGARWYLAPLGVLCAMSTPGFREYSISGYGEMPALTWFLTGLLLVARGLEPSRPTAPWFAAAGAAFSLAYLTKIVSLICIAPASLIALGACLGLRRRIRPLAYAAAGFAIPILSWELFRLIALGNVHAYGEWWHLQLGQVAAQSGAQASTAQLSALMHKGAAHFATLAGLTSLPRPVLVVLLAVPFLAFARSVLDRERPFAARFLLASLSASATAYPAWWLFITPDSMTWLRRVIDGLILQQCVAAGLLFWLGSAARPRPIATAAAIALLGPTLVSVFLYSQWAAPKPDGASTLAEELRVARAMRELPADAAIFGSGWWQSPVLALFSGRHILNYEHWLPDRINALPHKYLVADSEMQSLVPEAIAVILAASSQHAIIQSKGASLYQLDEVRRFPAFSPSDTVVANLPDRIDTSNAESEPKRGFYAWHSGWAWVRPDAAVLLARRDQSILSLDLTIPAVLLADGDPEPPALLVTADDCLETSLPIGDPGALSLRLPLRCPPWPKARVLQVSLHFNRHVALPHQLDADNRLLGLRVRAIRLEKPPT